MSSDQCSGIIINNIWLKIPLEIGYSGLARNMSWNSVYGGFWCMLNADCYYTWYLLCWLFCFFLLQNEHCFACRRSITHNLYKQCHMTELTFFILAYSALTLLVGRHDEHPASKNWVMRCWCGYLSGARCRLFAYGPTNATASANPVISCLI